MALSVHCTDSSARRRDRAPGCPSGRLARRQRRGLFVRAGEFIAVGEHQALPAGLVSQRFLQQWYAGGTTGVRSAKCQNLRRSGDRSEIDAIDISNPSNPTKAFSIDMVPFGGEANALRWSRAYWPRPPRTPRAPAAPAGSCSGMRTAALSDAGFGGLSRIAFLPIAKRSWLPSAQVRTTTTQSIPRAAFSSST